MLRKPLHTIFLVLLTTASLVAQQTNSTPIASTGSNPLQTTKDSEKAGELSKLQYLSAEQARQYVRNAFNLLRDYSVSIDPEMLSQGFKEDVKVAEKKPETYTPDAGPTFESLSKLPDSKFEAYLAGMEKVLERKIKKAESDEYPTLAAKTERQSLLNRLKSIMLSANCLVDKNDGIFIRTNDLDGNDIIAFRLDSLRSNARYSLVENYHEGLARIRKDQVYGFLNYCGEEVVPAQYEFADAFNSGKALVKKVNWYFIDSKGEESDALENIVDAKALGSGINQVKLANGKSAFINNEYDKTKQFVSAQYDVISNFYKKSLYKVALNKKYGLIALDGSVKLQPIYDVIEPAVNINLFKIKLVDRWGLMDSLGNIKFSTDYTSIGSFDNYGITSAEDEKGIHLLNAYAGIVTKGYSEISSMNTMGVALVRDPESKLFGIINDKLEVVVKPMYSSLGQFNQFGLAPACLTSKACGYIDNKGKEIVPLSYNEVSPFSVHGLTVASGTSDKDCTNGKCNYQVVLDNNGKIIIPKALKNADKITYEVQSEIFSKDYISIKVDDFGESGFQLINKNTKAIVNAVTYKMIFPADIYGIIRVADSKGKYGLIDSTGKVVSKCIYDEIRRPNENYYPAKDANGKWGFIDKKGKPQIPFEYEEVRNFRLGYTIVQKEKDKYGIINRFNAKVVPCAFKTATLTDDLKYILLEENGNEIILNDRLDCEKNCARLDEIRRSQK